MSKKHFEALAEMVQNLRAQSDNHGQVHVNAVARDLTLLCCKHNPRFDAYRFLQACGVEMPKV